MNLSANVRRARSVARKAVQDLAPPAVRGAVVRAVDPRGSPIPAAFRDSGSIFIHIPKSAGSSVKTELYGRPMYGHIRIADCWAYEPETTRAAFKFCFVRNPWDRFLSAYSYLRQRRGTTAGDDAFAEAWLADVPTFEAFLRRMEDARYRRRVLRWKHFRPLAWWVGVPGVTPNAMDFVGRYETLHDDMATVRERFDLPPQPLSKIRPSEHPPYAEAYDRRGRELVGELYAGDCALFGYAF
ncbi:sulfotransferase family 2 domain-containing protein [Albimonas pacifica]|uniref:Sulfotransferase family protein n=1 Tax=Albimonas pacifica TaxID=1114924 RepID=A0A1I3BUF4_9RHOB|nr:sulfotransferase family 2 domain-containing protein [Albimonas pacifica]SFH65863.1 Sulfotransferase family protein [Albimonas pacifica]